MFESSRQFFFFSYRLLVFVVKWLELFSNKKKKIFFSNLVDRRNLSSFKFTIALIIPLQLADSGQINLFFAP